MKLPWPSIQIHSPGPSLFTALARAEAASWLPQNTYIFTKYLGGLSALLFFIYFFFNMVWKKEVFEQEIPPIASLNAVFKNINIEKQKLYQQQVLISVSATEAAALGHRQDTVLWVLSAAIPFLHPFCVCKNSLLSTFGKQKIHNVSGTSYCKLN